MIVAGSEKRIAWICPKGHSYEARLYQRTKIDNPTNCPICRESKLNRFIIDYCLNQNIAFVSEYKFENCKNIRPLPFDIYLTDLNILIEGDGIQHFQAITHFGDIAGLKCRQINDSIKNHYCRNNNIPLLRIPYIYNTTKDKTKIEQFITDFIQTKAIPEEIKEFYKRIPSSNYIL